MLSTSTFLDFHKEHLQLMKVCLSEERLVYDAYWQYVQFYSLVAIKVYLPYLPTCISLLISDSK